MSDQLALLPLDEIPRHRRYDVSAELADAEREYERALHQAQNAVWATTLNDEATAARALEAARLRLQAARRALSAL